MKLEQAIELGKAAGIKAINESDMTLIELLFTLRVGHDTWSECAAGACAHSIDGVPEADELRIAYYRAYDDGAKERIEAIRDAKDEAYDSDCCTAEAKHDE